MEEVYDDIGEPSDYTALQQVEPKEESHEDAKDENISTDAPEPPPPRQHEYLELVNLWDSVLETVAKLLTTDLTTLVTVWPAAIEMIDYVEDICAIANFEHVKYNDDF